MPKWICPRKNCAIWTYAPEVRPVHVTAANPEFQAKDPHCPEHKCELLYTADALSGPVSPSAATGSQLHKIGTDDKSFGILVAYHADSVPVYCDRHQRKHIANGSWPGDTKMDKPVFLSHLFNRNQLTLCSKIASAVPWSRFKNINGGIDVIFNCGKTVVGTEKETDILVQGGWQGGKDARLITFHAYPVENSGTQANTFRSCKENGLYLDLSV